MKLWEAARDGNIDEVKNLLKGGIFIKPADPNEKDPATNKTALALALENNHYHITKLLISAGAKPGEIIDYRNFFDAISNNDKVTIHYWLSAGIKVENMDAHFIGHAFISAISHGHKDTVKVLLPAVIKTSGIDNLEDRYRGFMARDGHIIARTSSLISKYEIIFSALMCAANEGYNEIVQLLLSAGADVNRKNNSGATALMFAAQKGNKETIPLLLSAGAKIDEIDRDGGTALMFAAEAGRKESIKLLISAGAKIDVNDKNGETALILAVKGGHHEVVALLLSAGANVEDLDRFGNRALVVAVDKGYTNIVDSLLSAGAKVNAKNSRLSTALFYAVVRGNLEIVDLLLKTGADVDVKDSVGETPLRIAATNGHKEVVQRLLSANPKLDQPGEYNGTALMCAASIGHKDIVILLLSAGADYNLKDWVGKTALDIAKDKRHHQIITILEDPASFISSSPYRKAPSIPATSKDIAADLLHKNEMDLGSIMASTMRQASHPPLAPVESSASSLAIIPFSQLEFSGTDLGEGAFGVVRQGKWQFVDVAIKQLKTGKLTDESLAEFKSEAIRHNALNHPHIVRLYAVCLEAMKYSLVMELMLGGSLYELLHNGKELPWPARLSIAKDIAIGLSYLHDNNILHRDLKSLNVLLDDRMRAKLSDFGLSQLKTETRVSTGGANKSVGTVNWMAPELFKRGGKHSVLTDIYALGMVLWELASRKLPFADAPDSTILLKWVGEGERDEIPAGTPETYAALIVSCWAQDPKDRPSAVRKVAEALSSESFVFQPPANGGAGRAEAPAFSF